jgi:predicted RNA binding protein YcfA (HicA-like mRNA interferase family)
MRAISGKDFVRLLERRGWTLLRVQGSHHIYGKLGSIVRLSVPIHGSTPCSAAMLAAARVAYCRLQLHASSVLAADLEQRARDLAQREHADRVHQDGEDIAAGGCRLT